MTQVQSRGDIDHVTHLGHLQLRGPLILRNPVVAQPLLAVMQDHGTTLVRSLKHVEELLAFLGLDRLIGGIRDKSGLRGPRGTPTLVGDPWWSHL
jgi:hypothetical protein